MANIVTDSAISQLGKPYVFDTPLDANNANPASFDCSGLTMWCYARAGITIPHQSAAQYALMSHRPIADAQEGDIMFWMESGVIGHCAIYMGDGTIIEAPEPGKSVQRMPYAYWKEPIANVGVYTGPMNETQTQTGVTLADDATLAGATASAGSGSTFLGFNDHGLFSDLTSGAFWARLGLWALGGIIVLVALHYVLEQIS